MRLSISPEASRSGESLRMVSSAKDARCDASDSLRAVTCCKAAWEACIASFKMVPRSGGITGPCDERSAAAAMRRALSAAISTGVEGKGARRASVDALARASAPKASLAGPCSDAFIIFTSHILPLKPS